MDEVFHLTRALISSIGQAKVSSAMLAIYGVFLLDIITSFV